MLNPKQFFSGDAGDTVVRYISTRGNAPVLDFEQVVLAGLARDGGLYVPEQWPQFSESELKSLRGRSFQDIAFAIMQPFIGNALTASDLRKLIDETYAVFSHEAIAPLTQIGANSWILELFHGPTLAFKDIAMQFLARVFDTVLQRRQGRITIIAATSGDTGAAAVDAFAHSSAIEVFILHPEGRVSEVQRRQMTTINAPNIHNIALKGTFDDCQSQIKALFNNHALRDEMAFAGVNSINWVRILAQITYYFTSALALGAPERSISYAVPTGNFGDIYAALAARQMGLPIDQLIIASNANDILTRTLQSGTYQLETVTPTQSPSMDIQLSSNFERALYDLTGRDPEIIRTLMDSLAQSGGFSLAPDHHGALKAQFTAISADESQTTATLKAVYQETGHLIDPHTAVGVFAARQHSAGSASPMITLATAHPAKFPDAVKAATGLHPALPPRYHDLLDLVEHFEILDNDPAEIEAYIRAHHQTGN